MKITTLLMSTLISFTTALNIQAQNRIAENMDLSISPGTDFYEYAGGGWMKQHPLTEEYSRYGVFEQLREDTRTKLNDLVLEIVGNTLPDCDSSIEDKIALAYRLMTDSVKLNKEGIKPVRQLFQYRVTDDTRHQLILLISKYHRFGVDILFSCGVAADLRNVKENLVQLSQSGISLGQKDYYLSKDSATVAIREAYEQHIARMFRFIGNSEKQAAKQAAHVLLVETQLAQAFKSPVELRDPEANYHKFSFQELKNEFPTFDWETYFKELQLPNTPQEICVRQPEAIREALRIFEEASNETLTAYIHWKLLDWSASYLSDELYEAHFDFWGRTFSGKQTPQPRWKRAIDLISGTMSEALGQLFVAKHFPPEAKERMLQLVNNLQTALGQRIDAQEWMSDTTKQRAHEKLATFYVKIGYPDKWRDYSELNVKRVYTLVDFVIEANRFAIAYNLAQADKPVDRERWYMSPQTVNAYYNPTTNEICFPAAILQPPFFDMEADDASNYGAIGVVIGHEMSHGFDDKGRQFDKEGNLSDWWTASDAARFKDRSQVLVDFFNKIEVLPGLHANGELTLGENIADHGGLKISYRAYLNSISAQMPDRRLRPTPGMRPPLPSALALEKIRTPDDSNLTPEQKFFLAYALIWAGHITEEQIRIFTKSGSHPLGRWRVNGTLPHIDEWYEAFNIKPTDPLYVAPEKRANLW